jgi:hypothetical protein
MVTYCDDSSHTANPVGPIITDPDPVAFLPDDVYIDKEFYQKPGDPHWHIYRYGPRTTGKDGQARELLPDGAVLSPLHRRTKAQQLASMSDDTRESWSPQCRARTAAGQRCGQRGGRWNPEDRDKVITQLAERGVTGVSLRALDLIKHGGIRSTSR